VLSETFQMSASFCVLGSDNRGEFTGDAFPSLLGQYGVMPWRTAPHPPEQNGKMECFWGTIERCRSGNCSPQLIADIIHEYNTKWIHRALGMTPRHEAWWIAVQY
jgi:transposase InsO family protein